MIILLTITNILTHKTTNNHKHKHIDQLRGFMRDFAVIPTTGVSKTHTSQMPCVFEPCRVLLISSDI